MYKFDKRWKLMFVYISAVIFSLSGFALAGPLHVAAQEGDLQKVKSLIAKGSDVNVGNQSGLTPLHLAAVRGHKDVVVLLILKGANVNATDKIGITPLNWAARAAHYDVVELLIRHGSIK